MALTELRDAKRKDPAKVTRTRMGVLSRENNLENERSYLVPRTNWKFPEHFLLFFPP